MEIDIKLYEENVLGHITWVAVMCPGGPDISAQGPTPEDALENLALTVKVTREEAGGDLRNAVTW